MSRSQDRTEKPTERRKREARREGRVARSAEVGAALSMVALLVALRVVGPAVSGTVARAAGTLLGGAGRGLGGVDIGGQVLAMVLVGLLPFLGVTVALAIASGVAQVGFTLAPGAAKPKLSHLSLKKGLNRFKPGDHVVGARPDHAQARPPVAVVWSPDHAWIAGSARHSGSSTASGSRENRSGCSSLRATILALVIAAADYAVVRYRTTKEQKMTKQELKEEYKNSEGDPIVRQARRRRAMEMSRNRMITEVALGRCRRDQPDPLRRGVALRRWRAGTASHRQGSQQAGGQDQALRPIATASPCWRTSRSHGRSTAGSNVGRYVPTALFEAVATVLAVAYRRVALAGARGMKRSSLVRAARPDRHHHDDGGPGVAARARHPAGRQHHARRSSCCLSVICSPTAWSCPSSRRCCS